VRVGRYRERRETTSKDIVRGPEQQSLAKANQIVR
jgi:hypothetical protein